MSTVLVIEDDADVAELLVHRLRSSGHSVTTEIDGAAGLQKALEMAPDVVILDWMLPGMSGLDVCAEIRATPDLSKTKVLMLTAKAQTHDREMALAAGASDYVTKPFSPHDLLKRVEALTA